MNVCLGNSFNNRQDLFYSKLLHTRSISWQQKMAGYSQFFLNVYSKTSVETYLVGFHCTMQLELAKPVGLISYLIIVADVQNTSIWKMFVYVYVHTPRTFWVSWDVLRNTVASHPIDFSN